MRSLIALGLVFLAASLVIAADPPAMKEDVADKARKQFYQCWLAVEKMKSGVRDTDPDSLSACEFTPDELADWPRRGELSQRVVRPGPRIDPTTDPMRLDLRSEGYVDGFKGGRVAREDEKLIRVKPCIFKFDGDNLVIAYGVGWYPEKEFKKGEDYAERPKDFTSTKENTRTVETLKPCSKWDQD